MTLQDLKENWQDTEIYHKTIHEHFCDEVKKDSFLDEHRTFVKENSFGFGEDSFGWVWKLIVDEMPSDFTFLEIGVFRGQILSLIQVLASRTGRKVTRYGVTPLDTSGGVWESDYEEDIKRLHDYFFIPKDYTLYVGSSADPEIIEKSYQTSPYDILYIDGNHEKQFADSDLFNYAPYVRRGGYLVIDDACCDMKQPWGYFQGIKEVTDATLEYMDKFGNDWDFMGNVVHLRIYRKR